MAFSSELLVGAVFSLIGGLFIVAEFVELAHAVDSEEWPQVPGQIEETGVLTEPGMLSGTNYLPVVRYHYRGADKQYLSDRVAFGGTISSSFRGLAELSVRRYRDMKAITVRVSPRDPALSVLEPGIHWTVWIALLFGTVFFALGIRMLINA